MPSRKQVNFPRSRRALAAVALLYSLGSAQAQQPSAAQLSLCMACHGPQGNSQMATTPSLAGQPQVFLENQMVLIREGLRDIPVMKGLLDKVTDPEIVALASYFSAQTPVRQPSGTVDNIVYLRGQQVAS